MIYGYARVSTATQARDGNSLESQEQVLRQNGAEIIYKESFTGTKSHRPELDRLLGELKSGDTLIVTKLDRVARSTMQGCKLVEDLLEKNIRINILNMGVLDNTPASKLMRSIFFAFAEYERDMIVERTREGKAVAKTKSGYREGRPPADVPRFEEFYKKQQAKKVTVKEAIAALGISRATWYNIVKARRS